MLLMINKCMLKCIHCQELFKPSRTNNNNPKKYCSVSCSKDAHKRKVNKCVACDADTYNAKFCCSSCSASYTNIAKGPRTEDAKNNISTALKGVGSFTHIAYCKCEICNTEFLWNSITKGSKRHCGDATCFKQFKYNALKGKTGGYHPNSTRVHRSVYKGYQMDSGAELAFAQLLDKHNIEWIKNSSTFFEYLPNKKYYPDFYLPAVNAWIEVKGKKYVRQDDDLRWASVPGLEVIWSNDLKLPAILASVIGIEPT